MKTLKALKQQEGGATLVEILVAATIMALVLVASGTAMITSLRIMMDNEAADQASQLARNQIESYRVLDYHKVGLMNTVSPERNAEGRWRVLLGTTPIKQTENITAAGITYTVTTEVTWTGVDLAPITQAQAYDMATGTCVGGKLVKVTAAWKGSQGDTLSRSVQSIIVPGFDVCGAVGS